MFYSYSVCSSVFIVHQIMDQCPGQQCPHSYWKFQVSSLHQDSEKKPWIVGTWFYSPEDLKEISLSSR